MVATKNDMILYEDDQVKTTTGYERSYFTNYNGEYSQLVVSLQLQETLIHLYYKHETDLHTKQYFMVDAANRIQIIYPLYDGKI